MNPAKSIKKSGKYLKKVIGIDWIYTVAIRKRTDVSLFEGNLAPFAPMPYSTKYWYADPFLIDDQSGTYLFAEAFDRDQQVGRISVSTVSNEGEIGEPRVVLSEPYHLSFPMVFTWKDHYYMVPETSENNSINLYMASQFPYDWQMVKSWQVGKKLVDAVLIERSEGALHFLASEADEKNLLRCRFVKFALVGMDDPQTCDLAMDDSYNAGQSFSYDDRNAGAIVESKDGRILPTQSSTATAYGVSMAFRDVQKMSMTGSPVTKTENISIIGWNGKKLTGVHTYAQSNQFEVIDIRYVKYCPESIMPKIRKKLRKIQERIVSAK